MADLYREAAEVLREALSKRRSIRGAVYASGFRVCVLNASAYQLPVHGTMCRYVVSVRRSETMRKYYSHGPLLCCPPFVDEESRIGMFFYSLCHQRLCFIRTLPGPCYRHPKLHMCCLIQPSPLSSLLRFLQRSPCVSSQRPAASGSSWEAIAACQMTALT